MIYITSDLHLGHRREFLYQPRGFDSIEEHDIEVIKRWNEIVKPEDEVYILGDLMLNDNEHGLSCLQRLYGKKYFVIGNHDTPTKIDLYMYADIVNLGYATTLKYKKYNFYLSHYPTLTSNLDDHEKTLRQRVINLCGHSHVNDPFKDIEKGLIYHCELDAHNCYPVSLDTIIDDLKKFLDETQ